MLPNLLTDDLKPGQKALGQMAILKCGWEVIIGIYVLNRRLMKECEGDNDSSS